MTRCCFVPGCTTPYKKTGQKGKPSKKPSEKSVTFFCAPKDPVLRKRWHIASRRADREMTEKDNMCELHFTEDCIERYFITNMGDGTVFKLERARPRLKKGSIPTIFSFSNSIPATRRGRPRKRNALQNKENGSGEIVPCKKPLPSTFTRQVIVLTCVAHGCTNSSDKQLPGISFHRFPTNKTRRKIWSAAVGRKDWHPLRDDVLCSAHFTPDLIEKRSKYVRLKPGAVPTLFSFGEKQQMYRLPANLQTDFHDSSDSDRSESYLAGINSICVQESDSEMSASEADGFVQEDDDEIPEASSPYKHMPSKYFISENLIPKGHEEIFGKFVANELKTLSCDPPLYLRTKEKIWQILEQASRIHVQ